MPDSVRDFIAACFNMQTGLEAKTISRINFCTYMIEASDGQTYMFK